MSDSPLLLAVGIDPGRETGIAVKNIRTGEYLSLGTFSTLDAGLEITRMIDTPGQELYFTVEDARQRTHFGDAERRLYGKVRSGRATSTDLSRYNGLQQGAGWVRTLASEWEEFFTKRDLPLRMVRPQNTKLDAPAFARLTGWNKRSSNHARDAAMLIQPITTLNLKRLFTPSAAMPANTSRRKKAAKAALLKRAQKGR